jgi:uncharacterized protein
MTSLTAVIVMVKTPGLSPIKTRLAATLGVTESTRVYRALLRRTENILQKGLAIGLPMQPYWAVAEPEGLNHPLWHSYPTVSQGIGGLGARLHKVYSEALRQHPSVILVGADCPDMDETHLESAIAALGKKDWVVGPTPDGGFYLFGGNRPLSYDFWEAIPYSVSTTRESLLRGLAALAPESAPVQLSSLTDIDTEIEFREIASRLPFLME